MPNLEGGNITHLFTNWESMNEEKSVRNTACMPHYLLLKLMDSDMHNLVNGTFNRNKSDCRDSFLTSGQ